MASSEALCASMKYSPPSMSIFKMSSTRPGGNILTTPATLIVRSASSSAALSLSGWNVAPRGGMGSYTVWSKVCTKSHA